MRARLTLLLCGVLAGGCSVKEGQEGLSGAVGPRGPAGAPGPRGPAGGPGTAQAAFKDATGRVFARGDSVYVDARGYLWPVHVYGGLAPRFVTAVFYAQDDCTGQPYLGIPDQTVGYPWLTPLVEPRTPFQMPFESAVRARPDTLRSERMTMAAIWDIRSGCQPDDSGIEGRFFPVTAETLPEPPLETPTLQPVAPIHREAP